MALTPQDAAAPSSSLMARRAVPTDRRTPGRRSRRKYRLGHRVVDMGLAAINSMELREIAAPHLQQLRDETGYTVNMAILDGTESRCIAQWGALPVKEVVSRFGPLVVRTAARISERMGNRPE